MAEVLSLNKITTGIASHLDKEYDEPFKRIVLAGKVNAWRSTLLSRSLEKNPAQRALFKQILWVPMTKDTYPDCNETLKKILPVRYVSAPIPKPLRTSSITFDYAGSPDGKNPYKVVSDAMSEYLQSQPYAGKLHINYTDDKIYSPRPNPLIKIEAVFDDPIAVYEFNCSNSGNDCDYWDKPYPITYDFVQMITEYILKADYQKDVVTKDKEVQTITNP